MQSIADWNKLKAYNTDQKKSFEELCYQIAFEELKDRGVFTNIDDSGGGDGVEFFLTLENGDVWGWQAKFFSNPRLDQGGRKTQIKKSLQKAYEKHPGLKKWFLCNTANFTPEERTWYERELADSTHGGKKVLPDGHGVILDHWGDSELLRLLAKYPGVNNYFFDEKLFTWDWFEEKYNQTGKRDQVNNKYETGLHIQTDIDQKIVQILGKEELADLLNQEMETNQVEMYADDYEEKVRDLIDSDIKSGYELIFENFQSLSAGKELILHEGVKRLNEFKDIVSSDDRSLFVKKYEEFEEYIKELHKYRESINNFYESDSCDSIRHISWNPPDEELPGQEKKGFLFNIVESLKGRLVSKKLKPRLVSLDKDEEPESIKKENKKRQKLRALLLGPYYELGEYGISSLKQAFRTLELFRRSELHIAGEAGMGKTHVSFNIYEKYIKEKRPALFILAQGLTGQNTVSEQIKEDVLYDIPSNLSNTQILEALNISGRVYGCQVPIIIDGLNESQHWNLIWRTGLERMIDLISSKYEHLTVITTYRTSYESQLFSKNYFSFETDGWQKRAWVRGFQGLTWKAISRYFEFYKITLENTSDAIAEFEHPLYLKLFCEVKKTKSNKEVVVSFQNEDLFEVFDEYLENCNEAITSRLGKKPEYNISYVKNKLNRMSRFLWENKVRVIPRVNDIFDEQELHAFESENLLIFRNWGTDKEVISFTYDLLAGYLIAKQLIDSPPDNPAGALISRVLMRNKTPINLFIASKSFRDSLVKGDGKHPLFNDILRCFSVLCIKKENIFLFTLSKDVLVHNYATESLFEVNKAYISKNEELVKCFLKERFRLTQNRHTLFDLSISVELDKDHPLNFDFWSKQLFDITVTDRDLTWGEYIRSSDRSYEGSYFTNYVDRLYEASQGDSVGDGIHLAALKSMWILTTNDRKLRDLTTRALYYYGRKFPFKLYELLELSLDINDPYVKERVLAASYGLAMAIHGNVTGSYSRDEVLVKYAGLLFAKMFSENCSHPTTHILARDYAKRIIDIALIHKPDLLTKEQRRLITYPLANYPHTELQDSPDRNKGEYRDGNSPLGMDFRNYTVGRLVRERRNYDDSNVEYQKVLGKIYARIYDLGYSLEKFGELDKTIARDSWYRSNRVDQGGKVDRYGKKYAWIAFYEVAGRLSDMGSLKDWDGQDEVRIPDTDIDPSFPTELKEYDLLADHKEISLLGLSKDEAAWYDDDSDTDLSALLTTKIPFSKDEEWVMLQSFISQKDSEDQHRDSFAAINSVLINERDSNDLVQRLKDHEDFTFDHIETVSSYYVFEGEIPWCDLVPNDYARDFSVYYDFETPDRDGGTNSEEKTYEIETTMHQNNWESYHSDVIPSGSTITPSKAIVDYFKLRLRPQSSDMYDPDGNLVSTSFGKGERFDNQVSFTYIRKDYLQKYLEAKGKSLLHVQWCEKRYFENGINNIHRDVGKTEYRMHYRLYNAFEKTTQVSKRKVS